MKSLLTNYQFSSNSFDQDNSIVNLNNLREHNSSGEESSLPILNTPDSGILQSINSLDSNCILHEMATSNFKENQTTLTLNNDLNSNQLKDQLIKNGKIDYDEEKVHFDFLTASQLQKIVRLFLKINSKLIKIINCFLSKN